MSTNTFKLNIETPEGSLLQEVEVNNVKFKAEDGALQILANHISLLTTIQYSLFTVSYTDDNTSQDIYFVRKGIFNFDHNTNTARLVAEYCEKEAEVSENSIQNYLEDLKEKLKNKEDLSELQLVYLENEKFAVEKMIKEKSR